MENNDSKDMLKVARIENGVVIDHIATGKGMEIYRLLGLDSFETPVIILKNVDSKTYGKKDIIKVDGNINVDYDILGFVDPKATVSIIKDGEVVEKKTLKLPDKLSNVIKCKNPRCITTTETDMKHLFNLTDANLGVYRCTYCQHPYFAV